MVGAGSPDVRYRLPGWILGALLGCAAFAIGVNLFTGYADWGTFAPTGPPPRIEWCGRRYYPGSHPLTAQQFSQLPEPRRWARVLTTPSGDPVLAIPATAREKAAFHTDVCAMALVVRESPDRYFVYPLSGGP